MLSQDEPKDQQPEETSSLGILRSRDSSDGKETKTPTGCENQTIGTLSDLIEQVQRFKRGEIAGPVRILKRGQPIPEEIEGNVKQSFAHSINTAIQRFEEHESQDFSRLRESEPSKKNFGESEEGGQQFRQDVHLLALGQK